MKGDFYVLTLHGHAFQITYEYCSDLNQYYHLLMQQSHLQLIITRNINEVGDVIE